MRLDKYIRESSESLTGLYPPSEARRIVLVLLMHVLGIRNYTPVSDPALEVDEESLASFLYRLKAGEPIQYVTGECEFCSRVFKVGPGVLIPRPETEELVEYCRPYVRPGTRILDLCCGSGCIAWTLFLDYPGASVTALDISPRALEIARAQFEGKHPQWVLGDVFDLDSAPEGQFDLIVSNPPYVLFSQKAQMSPTVLDWEPSSAIFVSDDDPLLFYRALAGWAHTRLAPGGRFFAEINDLCAGDVVKLYRSEGFEDVVLLKDLSGRQRFVTFGVSKR